MIILFLILYLKCQYFQGDFIIVWLGSSIIKQQKKCHKTHKHAIRPCFMLKAFSINPFPCRWWSLANVVPLILYYYFIFAFIEWSNQRTGVKLKRKFNFYSCLGTSEVCSRNTTISNHCSQRHLHRLNYLQPSTILHCANKISENLEIVKC